MMIQPRRSGFVNTDVRRSFSTYRNTALLSQCVLILTLWLLLPGIGSALIGGEADNDEFYAAVVLMDSGTRNLCSATKIDTYQFLTAAHCVVDGASATLKTAFEAGGRIAVSHTGLPRGSLDFTQLVVQEIILPPSYIDALSRFVKYKAKRIASLRKTLSDDQLKLREQAIRINHQFSARFPDLAIIRVRTPTSHIPILPLDLEPVRRGDPVILVGFGCEQSPPVNDRLSPAYGRRTWGRTEVIRADAVNFYSYAQLMRADRPSLCPGDSGGPVLRNGLVVGVNSTVYGLGSKQAARSNMSVNLISLAKMQR